MHQVTGSSLGCRRTICMVLVVAMMVHPIMAAEALRETHPPGLDGAIDRGLAFLQKQQKADGSFDAAGPAHAMTGLAILAFLASGHTPDVGKYGLVVRSAVDWLLKQNPEGGYYGRDGGQMLSHCLVTIALAEVYGTETEERQRARVRMTLESALKVIFAEQDVKKDHDSVGGWHNESQASDSDLAVTGWCLMAMRACQNVGLIVPKQRFDRAMGFVLRCYRVEQSGFAYTPSDEPSAAMSAVALLSMYWLNESDRDEASAALWFIVGRPMRQEMPFWYQGLYAVALAAFEAGDPVWPIIWKRTYEQLMPVQRKDDGSWRSKPGEAGGDDRRGRFYSTAMACLALSIPLRLLPIFQR
ncbi:MAG: prenyltransferase/squalene oxidase repeat-containing protein [Bacillota bacterium]